MKHVFLTRRTWCVLSCLAGFLCASAVWAQSLSSSQGLSFGSFAATQSGGTITISPDGMVGHMGVHDLGGAQHQAILQASGTPSVAFNISYAPPSGTLTFGAETLTLQDYTDDSPGAFDITGNAVFNMGATLVVDGLKLPGVYSGSITVSIDYN